MSVAPKTFDYSNSTSVSAQYNGRLQVSSYSVSGVKPTATAGAQPEGGEFDYYADGQLKFASYLRSDATLYGLHERAFSYDRYGTAQGSLFGLPGDRLYQRYKYTMGIGYTIPA